MKLSSQKNILGVLVALILGVAIYSAVTIGDLVTRFQAYKSLQAITKLAKPIHASIESLQKERLLSSIYLRRKDETKFKDFKEIIPVTDKNLKNFAQQLKETQMLLLSIPETELEETRKTIQSHRNALNRRPNVFRENQSFYTNVIGGFLVFLDKMYDFSDAPEFQPLVQSLIAAEYYKESIAQEVVTVSHEISNPEIAEGQFPLIRQMLSDQIFQYEELMSTKSQEIKNTFDLIEGSAEKAAMDELHKRFEEKKPNLKGSEEDALDYIQKGNAYINRYAEFSWDVLKKLEKTAKEGKELFKAEMIKAGLIALIIIIALIGSYIGVQKIEVKEE